MLARVRSIFYSYPPQLIARWCSVSIETASSWKAGSRRPSRQALKLFALHRDQRVLGDAWRDWKLQDGVIIDPEGNSTTQAQLRAYWLIMQYAAELARRDPQAYEHFQSLLRQA